METAASDGVIRNTTVWWFVGAFALLLMLATNLPWQLDDYDQAKQAFTSFEMVKQGHWLYQHTPRGKIATKPPLAGWVSAAVFETTRSWDTAWRLPSLLSACALALFLFRAAKTAYGLTGALVACGAFSFNLLTPRLATLVRTDMPLTLVVFLIGLAIWNKLRTNEAWKRNDRLNFFLLLCAAMLIKGPIVYAFLLPGILVFEWWRRRRAIAISAWCGWWPWIVSLGIFLAWAAGGIRFVPGFYDQVVVREFLGRFGETIHRPQPFWFYLPHVLHKFAPWSLLVILLALLLRRSSPASSRQISPETMWLLCWSLGGLILMSFIPSKRVDRIFPVIPPLCLIVAAQIFAWMKAPCTSDRVSSSKLVFGSVAIAILFSGSYSAFKVVTAYRGHRDALVKFGESIREKASKEQWRYAAVPGSDEAMILYLDQAQFIEPSRAIALWKSGELDALVVPSEDVPSFQPDLPGASVTLESGRRDELDSQYVLLIRRN